MYFLVQEGQEVPRISGDFSGEDGSNSILRGVEIPQNFQSFFKFINSFINLLVPF